MKRHASWIARTARWVSWAAWAALIVSVAGAALAADLPRYKLNVGQELTYRTVDEPKAESADRDKDGKERPKSHSVEERVVTVLGQNSDGSVRVLSRLNRVTTREFMGKTTTRESESDCYFDLFADGRMIENRTLDALTNPTALFPPLPADDASLRSTWSATVGFDDTQRSFKAADSQPAEVNGTWAFVEDPRGVFDPIYLLSTHRDYLFDTQLGAVRKLTTTYTQGWPAGRGDDASVQTVELAGSRQLDDAEVAALRGEAESYFAARERYGKLFTRASEDFAQAAELYNEAAAELKKLDGELKLPEMRALLEQRLKEHDGYTPYLLKSAERFIKLIDKPSEDWKTTDLDGNPRCLADYKGKVVLLDFWYRGCGWCIRSMPQLNQLSADFPADQVAVLGMNNDGNLDDAKFVIEKMPLKYASLKNAPDGDRSKGINTLYGVQGWPTLVILDGDGVVRHIHAGYSPTLRKSLGDKIRELLAAKKPAN